MPPVTAPKRLLYCSDSIVDNEMGSDYSVVAVSWGFTRKSISTPKKVVECYSTSSIFRGYSIFMQNKDPRYCHWIPPRSSAATITLPAPCQRHSKWPTE